MRKLSSLTIASAAVAIGFGAMASLAPAAVIVNGYYQYGTPYAVPSNEVNSLAAPAPATVTTYEGATNANVSVLSNGTNGAGDFSDSTSQVVGIGDGTTITYTFSTPQLIWELDTYSEWRDNGRINQDYKVTINGDSVINQTVNYDSPGNGQHKPIDARVQIASSTGALDTGVTSIVFSFPTTQNTYVGYTELSLVPEPASLGLIGMAALGLLGRRRRA